MLDVGSGGVVFKMVQKLSNFDGLISTSESNFVNTVYM